MSDICNVDLDLPIAYEIEEVCRIVENTKSSADEEWVCPGLQFRSLWMCTVSIQLNDIVG